MIFLNIIYTFFILLLIICCSFSASTDCPRECTREERERDRVREKNEMPICANGILYQSLCDMYNDNCGKIIVIETDWNKCQVNRSLCPTKCLKIHDPVCADDGRIYPNKCLMYQRNCGKSITEKPKKFCFLHSHQSMKSKSCPDDCLELYKPVCASDGNVYFNLCVMQQQNCGNNKIQVVDMDDCVRVPQCPEVCLALPDPVCGSDGKLYLNKCKMLQQNCGKKISTKPFDFCKVY